MNETTRRRVRRFTVATAIAAAMSVRAGGAVAQEQPSTAPAPALSPPRLVTSADAVYPPAKAGTGESAVVVVTLVIDESGAVTTVDVTQSGGDDFDRAAIDAAKRLVFEPARRGDQPIVARIPFRFEIAPPAQPAQAIPAPDGLFAGRVLGPSGDPAVRARVRVRDSSGRETSVPLDAEGSFQLRLPPGEYAVVVDGDDLETTTNNETIAASESTSVVYRVRSKPGAEAPGGVQDIQVQGERPPREVTRRPIDRREIQRIPGTNGDALRAIENLPGVARPPGVTGLLIVRGSAPADTGIFVDGMNVPIAFHFGGLTSVVPSELLDRIDFYPGNFGPEYSRAMGGAIDIGLRSPRKDRFHGVGQLDIVDARVFAEAPLGKSTRFLVGGRRSYIDAWIGPVLEASGAVGVRTAPVYYDWQAMIEQDLGASTTGRLVFMGSDDRLALSLNVAGADPSGTGALRNHTQFYRIQARTETRVSESTRWVNMLSYGQDSSEFSLNTILDLDIVTRPLQARSDLRHKITDGLTAVAGTDILFTQADVNVYAAPIPEDGQPNGPFFGRPRRRQTLDTTLFQPGAYAMLEVSPVPSLKLLPSVRADYSSDIKDWRVAPRMAVRWDVARGDHRTTLKGGAGIFNQPPQPYQSFPPFGTPTLRHNQAQHYSAGVEQVITPNVELSIEGFYKKLDYLVDQRPDATGSPSGVTYASSGSGNVYGGELLLRYKPDSRFFGWIAYTISRSERRAADSEALRVFDFDQTHVLSVLGSYKLGRGWEIGARFRYVTGNPYTPASGAVYDADAGAYAPINGPPFSGRNGPFHRLDVRIDKTWTFASWKLGMYLDVQNAYSRRNPEGVTYNYNYAQTDVTAGLPILPVLGIRGEL